MQISSNSWHYKLYVFMSQWFAVWLRDYNYINAGQPENKRIGLCPYMRTILVWGPLAIISNIIPFGGLYLALIVVPASLNGSIGIMWTFGGILLLMFFVAVFIIMVELYEKYRYSNKNKSNITGDENQENSHGFWKLIKEYAVSIKTRVCPVLEVDEK